MYQKHWLKKRRGFWMNIIEKENFLRLSKTEKLKEIEELEEKIKFLEEHLKDIEEVPESNGYFSSGQREVLNLFIRRYNRDMVCIFTHAQINELLDKDVPASELNMLVDMNFLIQSKKRFSLNVSRLT